MPKFKNRVVSAGGLLSAAQTRVGDIPNLALDAKKRDEIAAKYLKSAGERVLPPPLQGGRLVTSRGWAQFWRDVKFFIEVDNSHATQMSSLISLNAKDALSSTLDIESEVLALESEVTEQEIRLLQNYDKVHFNQFVRSIDDQLQYDDKDWLEDWKTSYTYPEDELLQTVPNTGVTLPVLHSQKIPILNAVLLDEQTDTGDTFAPLISTSVRNVFLDGRVFRHVLIRKSFDDTSRRYRSKTSYDQYPYSAVSTCTMQLELPGNILLNQLEVEPAADSSLRLASMSYLSDDLEQIEMNTVAIPTPTSLKLFFEPIQTRYIILKFEQPGAITNTRFNSLAQETKLFNKLLDEIGFSLKLPEHGEEIQGRVFDFSIKDIRLYSVRYRSKGIFRSFPVEVNSPLGLNLSMVTEAIIPTDQIGEYHSNLLLPGGKALNEFYVGARIFDENGSRKLEALLPVPDAYPLQSEHLDPVGTDAIVKLFPDLKWNEHKLAVSTISGFDVTFDVRHELEVGDVLGWSGPTALDLPNTSIVASVIDEYSVAIDTYNPWLSNPPDITDAKVYVVPRSNQPAPFEVYVGEDTELTLGLDYTYSLNSGQTWLSTLDVAEWAAIKRKALAGQFRIRFSSRSADKFYWIQYRVLGRQKLNASGSVSLRNGRVVFDRSFKGSSGKLSTVAILRPSSTNHYLTPVLREYNLMIQEYVA